MENSRNIPWTEACEPTAKPGFPTKGRKLILAALALMLAALLMGCFAEKGPLHDIGEALGLDLTDAVYLDGMDSHGGFFGDGVRGAVLQLPENTPLTGWHPLPLTPTLMKVLYGVDGTGPYLTEAASLLPEERIVNGAYYFLDRHDNAVDPADDGSLLSRASLNFTLALYDADTGMLYYFEMDT